jgi:2-oxoisovalerate dehydrogenase E2 component (dihydrolipoyl transacylase)
MGRYVFKLPDVGEGTAEAEIVAWHVAVGDVIAEDQQLVDVMTDKATVEMTSPVSGKVISLHGAPGEMAPVGAPLVELEVEGAGNVAAGAAKLAPAKTAAAKPAAVAASKPAEAPARAKPTLVKIEPAVAKPATQLKREAPPAPRKRAPGDKPLASPAVRQRARDLGIELQFISGSGPVGRIQHGDLDAHLARGGGGGGAPRSSVYAQRDGVEEIKIIGLRRKIAEKMQDAKRRIPHFAYVEEVDVSELESLRVHLNAHKKPEQPKLTLLPFLMRALVRVLPDYPQINARFDDEAGVVHRHAAVHIGIATQTANGLMVPVVRHAEARDIWECASEVARVADLARSGKASREDLMGSTITITSLGPLAGVVTTPVINHPEVAIIGPNAIRELPVVVKGEIVVRKRMNISSSFDHRVVDGYDAAEFIQRIKSFIEHPATLFLE